MPHRWNLLGEGGAGEAGEAGEAGGAGGAGEDGGDGGDRGDRGDEEVNSKLYLPCYLLPYKGRMTNDE